MIKVTGFNGNELIAELGGYYVDGFFPEKLITDFEIDPIHFKDTDTINYCFISISNARWNKVHKKQTTWKDGNEKIIPHGAKCALIITETPIPALQQKVPQLIVENSYDTLEKLAKAARKKMNHPVIGITGSVGKSTTRLMLEHFLKKENTIVATRGNHNTQVGVPLYGMKLCSNPDIGILEISLNAINNRGNQSITVEPDVCIVTSIGEAHLSTLHSTENIAKFKARIFKGLRMNGLAIINADIKKEEFNILYKEAKKRTDRIKTYSLTNKNADLYLTHTLLSKYKTDISFQYNGSTYSFAMKMPSTGTIENILAVFLCLAELGYDIEPFLPKAYDFTSLDRVMELKQFQTKDNRAVDLLDDSHNAAVPSMLNAIRTFKVKQPFYKGTKILALGQIADLGDQSAQLHETLVPDILDSGADYVFGHGHYMRDVIKQLPAHMVGGWFNNAKEFSKRIPLYCKDDSLIMLKGSVSGSDFQISSYLLPNQLTHSSKILHDVQPVTIADMLQPVYGAIAYNPIEKKKIFTRGATASQTIEGLGHLVLLLLLFNKRVDPQTQTNLKGWSTNKRKSIHGKPFQKNERFTHEELVEELMITQHPSAIFELASIYFGSRNGAMKEISQFSKDTKLSPAATLNLTGRYRVKEQQSYNLDDLCKIGMRLQAFKTELPVILTENGVPIHGIQFGNTRISCIAFKENIIYCIIGIKSKDELQTQLGSMTKEQ